MLILAKRLKTGFFGVMLAGALIVAGCASTGGLKSVKDTNPKASQKEAADKSASEKKTAIEHVNVAGAGDRVLIGASKAVKYTVFKLSDPPRLIVDMPGVDITKVPSSIKVDNDFIKDITVSAYGPDNGIGRIVIALKNGVDYEIKSGENSLLVSLKKEAAPAENGAASGALTSKKDVVVKAINAPVTVERADGPSSVKEVQAHATPAKPAAVAPSEPSAQATKILKIEAARDGKNTVVVIQTDGSVGNYNAFGLDSPSRIVMDVWGVDNAIGKDLIKVKDRYLKTVRIGNYPDKTRLVFDMSGKMPPHSIKKSGNYIIMTIGSGVTEKPENMKAYQRVASLENAGVPKAALVSADPPAKTTSPDAPDEKTAIIESVDFRKIDGRGELTIRGSAKLNYSVKDSEDGKTVIFDIRGATIPEGLTRTLDSSKFDTAVLSISSYQESMSPDRVVRVLVKLKDKVPYAINASNSTIYADFKPALDTASAPAKNNETKTETANVEGKKEYTGKKIDLDMTDANITDVLRLLAEVSNLNIIASDDVKGTISLRLKNVPWDQAFDIILKSKGLDMIKKGNVILVAPEAKIKQEKEAVLTSKKAQEKLEELEIMFIPVNYANVNELMPQVKGVLSDRGSVTADLRTNTLIVKDIRKGREAAYSLVKRLDTIIPQVLIEARIVEAETSFLRDLGIQWGADVQTAGHTMTNTFGSTITPGQTPPGGTPSTLGTGGAISTTPLSGSPTFAPVHGVQDFAVDLPATGSIGTLGALGFVLGKAGANPAVLDLRISAGEQEGHLKTISRPRITTMDNKEAKIEQGESIPFETTSAAGTATTFIDANLSLTVTPHITPDGSVLMKIKASHNAIGTFKTATGEPSINKKESSTEVLVRDGETTVIGGIIVSDKSSTVNGIPFFQDIPILGWLFKSSSVTDTQTELLIFITPTILHEKTVG